MKAVLICIAVLSLSAIAFPAPRDSDPAVIAIAAAIPDATEIRTTSWGFKVSTPSGTRNVYKTSIGYRVSGSSTSDNLDIRKTATGYKITSNSLWGRAMGSR